jgi:enoyl-[acyl-carrier protein] reductase II
MRKAIHEADHDNGVQLIGQSQGLVHDVVGVEEIVQRVMQEAAQVAGQVAGRWGWVPPIHGLQGDLSR